LAPVSSHHATSPDRATACCQPTRGCSFETPRLPAWLLRMRLRDAPPNGAAPQDEASRRLASPLMVRRAPWRPSRTIMRRVRTGQRRAVSRLVAAASRRLAYRRGSSGCGSAVISLVFALRPNSLPPLVEECGIGGGRGQLDRLIIGSQGLGILTLAAKIFCLGGVKGLICCQLWLQCV
jgi:hypothetical protein